MLIFVLLFSVVIILFMIILCILLLANDREEANPAEIGTSNKPNPVIDRITGVAVELTTTTVSTDSKIVFIV